LVPDNGDPDDGLLSNTGAGQATGDVLVFMDVTLRPLEPDWLTSMLDVLDLGQIGAVGAKVFATDGSIAHAGIVIPRSTPHPVLRGANDAGDHYHLNLHVLGNYLAVSKACLMTTRMLFEAMEGFRSTAEVGFSDVDYCLRLRERGDRVVFTPFASLRYTEPCDTALRALGDNDPQLLSAFHRTWSDSTLVDPYYNPNFSQSDGQYRLDTWEPGRDTAQRALRSTQRTSM
jgi:hypothetical protein